MIRPMRIADYETRYSAATSAPFLGGTAIRHSSFGGCCAQERSFPTLSLVICTAILSMTHPPSPRSRVQSRNRDFDAVNTKGLEISSNRVRSTTPLLERGDREHRAIAACYTCGIHSTFHHSLGIQKTGCSSSISSISCESQRL